VSTIQHLDPTIRQRRTQRRNFLWFFERSRNVSTPIGQLAIAGWAQMVALRNDSGSTGDRKHLIAMRVYDAFNAARGAAT
jgi:hypothetical protein